ncbi:MAG: hypothetical protein JNL12_19430 [Planctomycetes bacterium]|nr:hypothetical protein [Planctomycetota bacterium]
MPDAPTRNSAAFSSRWRGKCQSPSWWRRLGVGLVLAAILPLCFAEGHGEFGPGDAFAISALLLIAGVCCYLVGLATRS